ncbi:hypothetical protein [Kaarinaea lacus]
MHSEKLSVTIPAARQQVYDYIADIKNFPQWATEFCQELRLIDSHYKLVSPMGELYFRIEGDPRSGEINFFTTNEIDGKECLPTKVISHNKRSCEYVVDFCQPPGVGDTDFQQQCASLRRELENIKSYFESIQ